VVFTAHSVPVAADAAAGLDAEGGHRYSRQVAEAARLVAEAAGVDDYDVVWQSRSGPPQVRWLEPDVLDHLDALHAEGVPGVVAAPIGFVSDHLEVRYDLDVEAREVAERVGLPFARAASAGTHPAFVAAIREAIAERLEPGSPKRALGRFGPSWDTCAPDCCRPGSSRVSPWDA
jgi:ferrochelatase